MRWNWIIWTTWICFFLVFELTAVFSVTPWTTLSEFSWRLEDEHWLIHALFFGFLIGLVIHIVFRGPMWRTQLTGLVIALLAHFINARWP